MTEPNRWTKWAERAIDLCISVELPYEDPLVQALFNVRDSGCEPQMEIRKLIGEIRRRLNGP